MPKYIGLSSRECFRDMALGLIDPKSVLIIVSGINVNPYDEESIQELVDLYELNAWRGLPDAAKLFRLFLEDEKIEQPRQYDKMPPNISLGHWIVSFTHEEILEQEKKRDLHKKSTLRDRLQKSNI